MLRKAVTGLMLWLVLSAQAAASTDYTEIQAGAGQGGLLALQGDYATAQLGVALGEYINDAVSDRLNVDLPGEWSLRLMPWASWVCAPESNAELGCMISLKIGFPVTDELLPYLAAGTGPMYTTQETQEQSTQFNFASYGAVGLQYRLNARSALGLEYWVRHVSNAGIRDPNDGIDTRHWMLSYTLFAD